MKQSLGSRTALALGIAVAAAFPQIAQGQEAPQADTDAQDNGGLQDIIVTAQRRDENIDSSLHRVTASIVGLAPQTVREALTTSSTVG